MSISPDATVHGTSSPSNLLEHLPSAFPGTYCRLEETNDLHTVFPINKYLKCTEENCEAIFIQKRWSDAQFTILRHLTNVHEIPKPTVTRWCSNCKITIPVKITSHKCFKSGGYFQITHEETDLSHKCSQYHISFPTSTGLSNHVRWHTTKSNYENANASTLKQSVGFLLIF